MKFRKKPVVIEAITFDELVAFGRTQTKDTNGMPWSFTYAGKCITHENDDCYLIPTLEGTMRFNRGEMLITGVKGEIYPCKADIFEQTYDVADADATPATTPPAPSDLRSRLQHALNSSNAEGGSDSPDFVLAGFLVGALRAFDAATLEREAFYGRHGRTS